MRLTVGAKLLGGMAAVIALTAALGASALYSLAVVNDLTTKMSGVELAAVRHLGRAEAAVTSHRLGTVQLIATPDALERERQATRRREAEPAFRDALTELEPLIYRTEGRRLLSQIQSAWADYKTVSDQVAAAAAVDTAEAERLSRTTARERHQALSGLLDQLAEWKDGLAAEEARAAARTYEQSRNASLVLLGVVLVVGCGVALWLARTIGHGVRTTAGTAALIASGDLTRIVTVRSRDEVGDLAAAFNSMVTSLREVTREIRDSAQSLAAATGEILASVTQQGASATEQAAAVSQTTVTVDEVRVTAQQASQKAQHVAHLAQQAADVAEQGLRTVEETVAGMRDLSARVESLAEQMLALSEQTQQIGDIITAVDELADQSNLLAVNAAIEAARAGDQGRGFSVVADEVRRLAERSKTATVQVRTILTEIQRAANAAVLATEQGAKGAEQGARLVSAAGDSIRQLAAAIRESADAAQQIVASAGQQGAGMDQIATAIANINQATTETAAGTRQLQKAAENINDLAHRLSGLVDRYKLDGAATTTGAAAFPTLQMPVPC